VPLRFKTIRAFSQHLLLKVDFVDCYGRNIGLGYAAILERIKAEFPKARATMGALRYELYFMRRGTNDVRLPARCRTRLGSDKILSREFARSLLMQRDEFGVGLPLRIISDRTQRKFSRVPIRTLSRLANAMVREGLKVPERPS